MIVSRHELLRLPAHGTYVFIDSPQLATASCEKLLIQSIRAALSRNGSSSFMSWPRMLVEMFFVVLLGLSTLLGTSASTSTGECIRRSFGTKCDRAQHRLARVTPERHESPKEAGIHLPGRHK